MKTAALYASAIVLGSTGGLFLAPALAGTEAPPTPSRVGGATDGPSGDPHQPSGNASPGPERADTAPPYPRNKKGLTYGSGAFADDRNPGPDLILAYGVKGYYGYVKASDLPQNAPAPSSPEQAHASTPAEDYMIPLYDLDGETVIDQFQIDAGANPVAP